MDLMQLPEELDLTDRVEDRQAEIDKKKKQD